jgi:hypothetical protein
MKKNILMSFVLFAAGATGVFAAGIPVLPHGVVELEDFARVFVQAQQFEPYAELLGRFEDTDFQFRYRSLTLGSYYRVLPNLKVGLFYRLQAGARHNDDWIEMPTPSGWGWRDTRGRYENILIADVSPRFIVGFLDRNLVFMLKNRVEYNFFNSEMSALVRPGLTYFYMVDREPRAEISLQYAVYFALNFGEAPIYSYAPYLQVLYHITQNFQFVGGLSYVTANWSTSADAKIWASGHYVVDYTAFRFQAGIVYTLPSN